MRVSAAALRGRRVSLSVASSDARDCSSRTSARCSARPRCASRRFVPPKEDAPPGSPIGVVVTGSRALVGVRVTLERRRGSAWQRVGAGRLKAEGARVRLNVRLPRARRRARRVHGQ